jgi:hypothetical protein
MALHSAMQQSFRQDLADRGVVIKTEELGRDYLLGDEVVHAA